ncbi:hypothetical protein MTP99_005955 [Tenebrio molitor]|nr:hypothetical protein MTP99_005955 [Tenebrio molitor]
MPVPVLRADPSSRAAASPRVNSREQPQHHATEVTKATCRASRGQWHSHSDSTSNTSSDPASEHASEYASESDPNPRLPARSFPPLVSEHANRPPDPSAVALPSDRDG